eukprot:scaffold29837_cov78-Skeletonema_dohrnii-CCMP3373.AAC.1
MAGVHLLQAHTIITSTGTQLLIWFDVALYLQKWQQQTYGIAGRIKITFYIMKPRRTSFVSSEIVTTFYSVKRCLLKEDSGRYQDVWWIGYSHCKLARI